MTTAIREKELRFEFGEEWLVVKYDEHSHYRCHLAKIKGAKALDMVGLRKGEGRLYLIEAKDFRKAPMSVEERQELPQKVSRKVKDTIAGMVGARQIDGDTQLWRDLCGPLVREGPRPRVIFLLVENVPPPGTALHRHKSRRDVVFKELKRLSRWLTTDVVLVNLHEWPDAMPGASVVDFSAPSNP